MSAALSRSATTQLANARSTLLDDIVFAVLGLVVVSSVYADGRAHILGLPDSFFTPWHAFLYGGLGVIIIWLAVMSSKAARRTGARRRAAIPDGYGYSALGAALFAVGGVADMVWHMIFGIEPGIDALLSPSHLLLFIGGGLLLSGPVLAFRRRGDARIPARVPALLAVIGITGVAAFALSYLSAFITDAPAIPLPDAPEGTEAHRVSEGLASAGLGSFIVTSLVLVIPAAYLLRVQAWFPGALAALVTAIAVMATSLTGFQNATAAAAAFASAALVDVSAFVLDRRTTGRTTELLVAAGLPIIVWTGQLITFGMGEGLGWSEEMSSGVVLVSALVSFSVVLIVGSPAGRVTTEESRFIRTPARSSN